MSGRNCADQIALDVAGQGAEGTVDDSGVHGVEALVQHRRAPLAGGYGGQVLETGRR
jgi:hypothetical protein